MKKKQSFFLSVSIALFAIVFISLFYTINSIYKNTNNQQLITLKDNINRAVVQCYAIEGYYPESLDYLKEHYGITYDEKKFFVNYRPIAQNIKPELIVVQRNKD